MMHKKIVAVAVIILMTAFNAHAGAFDETRGYFGGEFSFFNKTSYNGGNTADLNQFKASDTDSKLAIEKNKPGINIFAGMRFTESLGIEIGFGFIDKVKAQVQNNNFATNKISNIYLDGLGYLQVSPCVDLIGLVGVGVLKSKPDVSNIIFENKQLLTKQKIGYRLGGGAQYYITDTWSSRLMVRYQSGSKDFLRGLTSIAVGITYTFL